MEREYREWAESKHPVLTWMAALVALNFDVAHWLLVRVCEGLIPRGQGSTDREWLRLYRCHRDVVRNGLLSIVSEDGRDVLLNAAELIRGWPRLSEADQHAICDVVNAMTAEQREEAFTMWRSLHAELRAMLDESIQGQAEDMTDENTTNDPLEVEFFMRIWLPCWMIYGEQPGVMYRRARLGDLDALVDLLLIDKRLIGDRMINGWMCDARDARDDARRRKLADAFKGRVSGAQLKPERLKIRMISLISGLSHRLAENWTEPDIRRLFDIVASHQRRELRDMDLPASSEALAKAMQRGRKELGTMLPGHKSPTELSG